ncbi:MAG: DegT/DnrJ/EryC1/StrS family aminotransferase [Acidobacteriota bacterium]
MQVPFFRPDISEAAIDDVTATIRSGWLTTGPRVKRFEEEFAAAVGARHAVALNSCTAALHLACVTLGLQEGQGVLIPTMTMAATAEVVRYQGAVPILVDCEPDTMNMDLADAEAKIEALRAGRLPEALDPEMPIVGMIPVHVGGWLMDIEAIEDFAERHGLWVVEDAAHAFPAAWRSTPERPWRRCGGATSAVSCFSFYANKTITTGEGGMATTDDPEVAERIRLLSLHGLSADAWGRFTAKASWDYRIVAPGYKYNLTDIAAAIGLHQLERAESLRQQRQNLAQRYYELLGDLEEGELPPQPDARRLHSWHLFLLRLRLDQLGIDRLEFTTALRDRGVGHSVHWRPLHLHPYWRETFGWRPQDLPTATECWQRIVSLPLFPTMTEAEMDWVVTVIRDLCHQHRRRGVAAERV